MSPLVLVSNVGQLLVDSAPWDILGVLIWVFYGLVALGTITVVFLTHRYVVRTFMDDHRIKPYYLATSGLLTVFFLYIIMIVLFISNFWLLFFGTMVIVYGGYWVYRRINQSQGSPIRLRDINQLFAVTFIVLEMAAMIYMR